MSSENLPSPAISVLIPTYGYARFLPDAIESVLAQDFNDFELIIADDASKDNSAEVIQSYAAKDRRIKPHIHKQNQGIVKNWNWCLGKARGEYVHYLFGDDKLACPHALRSMHEAMRANPSAVLATSPRFIINEESHLLKLMAPLRPGLYDGAHVIAECIGEYGNVIGEPSVVMFRRDRAMRGFDESYVQLVDLEMWLNLLEHGDLVVLNEPLACFRKHACQQSALNRTRLINRPELARLFWSYEKRGLLPASERRHLLFKQLYELKKTKRLCPCQVVPENDLLKELGRLQYPCLWALYKISSPLRHFRRWLNRRGRLPSGSFDFQPSLRMGSET